METTKERLISMGNFLVINISCSFFQIFVLGGLAILQFVSWFSFGPLFSPFINSGLISPRTAEIIIYASIAIIYVLIWLGFWTGLYNDGIKWFYYRVTFLTIPLIIFLFLFDPSPNPYAMIDWPKEPIFSGLVTASIMLPIYSVSVYKFILQRNTHKVRNTILVCSINLILAGLIYALSWNMMPMFYDQI